MKKYLLLIPFLTIFLSCERSDQSLLPLDTITFKFEHSDEITKSYPFSNENELKNINLLLYDSRGKLSHFTYRDDLSTEVELEIGTNTEYTIYAIANSGDMTGDPDIGSESSMADIYMRFDSDYFHSAHEKGIPMSARIPPRRYSDGEEVTISLVRLLSKFRVMADTSSLDRSVRKFDIRKARIRNINTKVHYFRESAATSDDDIMEIGATKEGEGVGSIFSTGIDFYLPENMQGNLTPGNIDEKSHIPPEEVRDLCSYIEFLVDYRSETKYDNELVYRYFIHDGSHLDNFDIERNRMYVCTTLFRGSGINEETWRIEKSSLKKLVTNITLTPQSYKFTEVGKSTEIIATILPHDAENNTLTWSSSAPDIATVDQYGKVTSVSDGTCTITARANDISGVYGTATITVNSYIYPSSVSVTPSSYELYSGEKVQLTATVLPQSANNKSVTWSSSNSTIASVNSSGNVTAHSPGECRIYAVTSDNHLSASSAIKVKERSFTLYDIPTLYPNYNSPFTIRHSATPSGVPVYTLERSSGEECLSLSGNTITANYTGAASSGTVGTYTLKGSLYGMTRTMDISVNIGNILIDSPGTISAGSTKQCRIIAKTPSDAAVEWSSSDPSIASVDHNGTITAFRGGDVTITAKCSTGAYSSVTATVMEPYINISSSGETLLNTNITSANVAGYPRSLKIQTTTNVTTPIEWAVTDRNGKAVQTTSVFNITGDGTVTPVNSASGKYFLKAISGDVTSNTIEINVYVYLEYIPQINIHSYDKTKDEVTFDYQIESSWSDESWQILNTNYDWVYNFVYEPRYKIVKVDNEWGYSYISYSNNMLIAISSINRYSSSYDSSEDSDPDEHPEKYITFSTRLRNLDGSATATGKKGIKLEDSIYGYYFYVKQKQ